MQSLNTANVRIPLPSFLATLFFALALSCNTVYQPRELQYTGYRVSASGSQDTVLLQLIGPYSDSVNKSMNGVIGVADVMLERQQPEGSLGNFMTDAILHSATKHFNVPVDAAFVNQGGVRITQLPKGPITRGKIFELMPFDNILVLQELSGAQLQQFLDYTAARGGWPMAGISMGIRNKKAVEVKVGGQPLDMAKTYAVVNSDYVVNGGDDAAILKNIPQKNTGYLMRDAIIDYVRHLQSQGKSITGSSQKRITDVQ